MENSIADLLDAEFYLKNHVDKFSSAQYQEIKEALDNPCKIRVMTFNLLSKCYDRFQKPENKWAVRKGRIVEVITESSPDILCCQELTPDQIEDLKKEIGNSYAVFAPLAGDRELTEMLGIFYKKGRFELQEGSKKELGAVYYWEEYETDCFQYYLKCRFLDQTTGKKIVVYNTHTDYLKPEVRMQTVSFLLEDAEQEGEHFPTIIAGDFNTHAGTLPDRFKRPLTPGFDGPYLLQTITKNHFRNSLQTALIAHVGPLSSFTHTAEQYVAFTGVEPVGCLYDHIFVTPKRVKVLFHAVEPATVKGLFPSDHLPVLADLSIF